MLGDLLRQTREQKNLSLSDIEQGTNIRKLYIKAIEDGEYDKLPGEVFLKGFIKTYGRFLGLDGQALIQQYKAEKNGSNNSTDTAADTNDSNKTEIPAAPAASAAADEPENKTAAADSTAKAKSTTEPAVKTPAAKPKTDIPKISSFETDNQYLKAQNSSNKRNIILLVVIIAVIIGGALAYLSLSSDEEAKPAAPAAQTQQQPEQTSPQAQQQPTAPVSGSDVTAVFNQDCWTEVTVDGKVVLSETVKAGSSLNWKGTQQVDITVGNAGAVDITFNGQPAGKLGDVGAVVTKSFPAPDKQPAAAQPAQQNSAASQSAQNQQQQNQQ